MVFWVDINVQSSFTLMDLLAIFRVNQLKTFASDVLFFFEGIKNGNYVLFFPFHITLLQ